MQLTLRDLNEASSSDRKQLLNDLIRYQLAEFLSLGSIDEIEPDERFADLGTDSLQAVDFKIRLEKLLDCSLRSTILFEYPRVDLLVEHLHDCLWQNRSEPLAPATLPHIKNDHVPSQTLDKIAIVALECRFPEVASAADLWTAVLTNRLLQVAPYNQTIPYGYGRIDCVPNAQELLALQAIGISDQTFRKVDRQQKLLLLMIAKAFELSGISFNSFKSSATGVFIGCQPIIADSDQYPTHYDENVAYQIPVSNKLSFQLDLQGPSEVSSTFCSSVFVALHRAIQSIHRGECEQAIVGGVNVISERDFIWSASHGRYDSILSSTNQTRSFSNSANGFVRSEGVGTLVIKPLLSALKEGQNVLAIISSSAVHHGGRSYNLESPNVKGMHGAILSGFQNAKLHTDECDYVEAHGIGNIHADAIEWSTINNTLRSYSQNHHKRWRISTIKPSVGHPEFAAGIASITKAIYALRNQTIPGIAGLQQLNDEIDQDSALIATPGNTHWESTNNPRRVALSTYGIGGVNSAVLLEEYASTSQLPSTPRELPRDSRIKIASTPSECLSTEEQKKATLKIQLSDQLQQVLYTSVHKSLGISESKLDVNLSPLDYGIDSIKIGRLVQRLNEELGVRIKLSQIFALNSFSDFFQLVANLTDKKFKSLSTIRTTSTQRRISHDGSYSLSETQKGLWYISEQMEKSTSFNVPLLFTLKNNLRLDKSRIEEAVRLLLEKHPILRARICLDNDTGDLQQSFSTTSKCAQVQEMEIPGDENTYDACWKLLRIPFRLDSPPLIRLYILRNASKGQVHVYFVIHHIVIDGLSAIQLIESFWDFYIELETKHYGSFQTQPDFAFLDFIEWERNYLGSPDATQSELWWSNYLADTPTAINLPYEKVKSNCEIDSGVRCESISIDNDLFDQVKLRASEKYVNLSVYLMTCFGILLNKISNDEEFALTTPVSVRPLAQFEKGIGCFINLVITRFKIDLDESFEQALARVKKSFLEVLDHSELPYSRILKAAQLSLGHSSEPVFPVSFTYQNIFDAWSKIHSLDSPVTPQLDVFQEIEDDYTLEVYDFRNCLQINLKYQSRLFSQATIRRQLGYLLRIIEQSIQDSSKRICQFEILSGNEKERLLNHFNKTSVSFPTNKTVAQLFVEQSQRTPNNKALEFAGRVYSYKQLEMATFQFTSFLNQLSVVPGNIIAVVMDRSASAIITVLGILRAGCTYLPIDPATPSVRIRFMIEDAKVSVVCINDRLHASITESLKDIIPNVHILSYEEFERQANERELSKQDFSSAIGPDSIGSESLAYIMYTSGTTGVPKGVMVRHRSLTNLALAMIKLYEMTATDKVLQFASLSFDMSVEEIFPSLISGASVCIREDDDLIPWRFSSLVLDNHITIANLPPAFFAVLDELPLSKKEEVFNQLRIIAFGGDSLPASTVKALAEYNVQLFNVYGPTECTVNAAAEKIEDREIITIGKPIENTQLYILDKHQQLVPIGVVGELYIGGEGVAAGYLNNQGLTDEKFVNIAYTKDQVYRTGDLARWLDDGRVEHLGRNDDQVNVRGFRVEIGEVETAMSKIANVLQVAVIAKRSHNTNQLVAYFTSEHDLSNENLRAVLSESLPAYMIPDAFYRIDELPLTSNRKIDRKALRDRKDFFIERTNVVGARTDSENRLTAIWQEVLGVETISIEDDFFRLGGESLKAIQVVARISRNLGVTVTLKTFFTLQTIRRISEFVDSQESTLAADSFHYFTTDRPPVIL